MKVERSEVACFTGTNFLVVRNKICAVIKEESTGHATFMLDSGERIATEMKFDIACKFVSGTLKVEDL